MSTGIMEFKDIKKKISGFISLKASGLGIWNSYFIFKFGLLYFSYINFDLPLNFMLAALLCIHIGKGAFHFMWRALLAVLAFVLLYHDSYLPGISQIMAQKNNLQDFSLNYVVNFIWDFVSMPMVFSFIGVLIGTYFLKSYIRVTSAVFAALLAIGISGFIKNADTERENELLTARNAVCQPEKNSGETGDIAPMLDVPNSRNLEKYVTAFFDRESQRRTEMPDKLVQDFVPFDIILLNICSVSKDDIRFSRLENHPVFSKFDITFEHFNGATSYSVPASLRLLRASCGQQTEGEMYKGRRPECEILNNLSNYGFSTSVFLDHNGIYGDYLASLKSLAGLNAEPKDQELLKINFRSFDGSPIYSDAALFEQYMNTVAKRSSYGNVSFFNLITLHDGNHTEHDKRTAAYEPRLNMLLNDINVFAEKLENSRRNVLFIMIPEHGAAMQGDKMQIAKLREIPTDKVTELPVYIRFFGRPQFENQLKIQGSHSYLALSEIIMRTVTENLFSPGISNIGDYMKNLPQTAPVSESTNAFFIKYRDKGYYKLKGGEWAPYVY